MKIIGTQSCQELVSSLREKYGEILFHLSSGCCDGSSPTCLKSSQFHIGANDVHAGDLCGVPFYMPRNHYERLQNTDLTIDVVSGYGSGFSLEAPEGKTFIVRSGECSLPT